jgi:phage terminase large subunit
VHNEIQLPEKVEFLFSPKRFKVLHGGRGSAKSHSVASALLILGRQKPLRILCTREIQKSIRDSVHRLLSDKITSMGMSSFYQILDTEIRGKNGTLILFGGLSTTTIESIKSFEGVDIVWVEEAQVVTKRSWDILIPTIRKAGSEIWITMNPILDTDETYVRFIENADDDMAVVQMNWRDNPWWSDEMEQERLRTLRNDSDNYDNIWEGKTKSALIGAIYAKEIELLRENNKFTTVPYDPSLLVNTAWDLGVGDATAIWFYQKVGREIRIIDYYESSGEGLPHYASIIKQKNYLYGEHWAPHDIAVREFSSGRSRIETAANLGINFLTAPRVSLEDGIHATRMILPRCYFDVVKCAQGIECLKRYRWERNEKMEMFKDRPVHDQWSHGADAFRYLAITIQDEVEKRKGNNYHQSGGWMG